MNALARFEGFMQELMDRRVIRLLGGSLQPVELAHAIARCLDGCPRGALAPNHFRILLNPEDVADIRSVDGALERKLAEYAVELARERGLNFQDVPSVLLVADADLERSRVEVRAELTGRAPSSAGRAPEAAAAAGSHRRSKRSTAPGRENTPSSMAGVLAEAGPAMLFLEVPQSSGRTARLPVDRLPFVIGRSEGSDLVLADPRVSRRHAVIDEQPDGFCLRDLDSRNGSNINGQPVAQAVLQDGDCLGIGGFEVVVRIPVVH